MTYAGLYGAVLWVVLVVIITIAAGKRGRNGFGYFLLSLVFSPLAGLIALATIPDPPRTGAGEPERSAGSHKGSMAI
jgi:hypothetical protein